MTPFAIKSIFGRRVWDSRGRPTVEAEVILNDGSLGRAIAPAGASKGSREALELRDGGARFGGLDVMQAIEHVNRTLGTTTVVITHNLPIANMADRVLRLADGRILGLKLGEIAKETVSPVSAMPEGLLDALTATEAADLLDYLMTLL